MAQLSPWRVNDAVAYDLMRATASELARLLLSRALDGGPDADAVRRELIEVRRAAARVDGFDRRAVDAMTARFRLRVAEASGTPDV